MSTTITVTVTRTYPETAFTHPDDETAIIDEILEDPAAFFDGAEWEIQP